MLSQSSKHPWCFMHCTMQILCATHTSVRSAGRACVITVIHAALMFCSLHNANPLSHTHLSTFRRRGVCYHSHPRSPDVLFTARCKSSVPYTPQYVQQEGRVLSQSSKQPWCFVHCTMQILCATHTSVRSVGGACVITVIQAALVFCSLHDANPLCHTHLSTFSRRGVCYHSHPSSLTLFCSVPAIDVFLCAIHTSVRSAGRACWS